MCPSSGTSWGTGQISSRAPQSSSSPSSGPTECSRVARGASAATAQRQPSDRLGRSRNSQKGAGLTNKLDIRLNQRGPADAAPLDAKVGGAQVLQPFSSTNANEQARAAAMDFARHLVPYCRKALGNELLGA